MKLGDLEVGDEGAFGVQVTFAWGLSNGMKASVVSMLGGSDRPIAGLDVRELPQDWEPLELTSDYTLSPPEVDALRAAYPDFGTLLDRAAADGFALVGTRDITLSDGRAATIAYLGKAGALRQVLLEAGVALARTLQSTALELADTGGSLRLDVNTGMGSSTGSWVGGAHALSASSAKVSSFGGCLRNLLLKNAFGLSEYGVADSVKYLPTLESKICRACFANDKVYCLRCFKSLVDADPKARSFLESKDTTATCRFAEDDSIWSCRAFGGTGGYTLCLGPKVDPNVPNAAPQEMIKYLPRARRMARMERRLPSRARLATSASARASTRTTALKAGAFPSARRRPRRAEALR